MAALWDGIRMDSPAAARAAFFPQGAYLQLKTIGDPQGDYQGRLLGDYGLDIGAAHGLLGARPAQAQLLEVRVPDTYAHWVPAGVCDNSSGYYEVAHSRLVYRADGEVRSFGIASMISWRGVWYVIHLGAILRSSSAGVVEDPQVGTGVSPPSSTC
jgi:hypothetical protein